VQTVALTFLYVAALGNNLIEVELVIFLYLHNNIMSPDVLEKRQLSNMVLRVGEL